MLTWTTRPTACTKSNLLAQIIMKTTKQFLSKAVLLDEGQAHGGLPLDCCAILRIDQPAGVILEKLFGTLIIRRQLSPWMLPNWRTIADPVGDKGIRK